MKKNQSPQDSHSNHLEHRVAGINYAIPPDFLYLGPLIDYESVAEDSFPLLMPEWNDILAFANANEDFFLAFFGDLLMGNFEEYLLTSYSPEWLEQIIQNELFMEITNQTQLLQQEDPMPLFDLLVRYSDFLSRIHQKELFPLWFLFEKNPALPYF